MDQAVQIALTNNPSVQLAEIRLQNAHAEYDLTLSGGLPQVRADVVDTQSSDRSFAPGGGSSSSIISLPNGGAIPIITDQGAAQTGASGFSSSPSGGAAYVPPTAAPTVTAVTPAFSSAQSTTTTGSTTTTTAAARSQAVPALAAAAADPNLPPVLNALAAAAQQSGAAVTPEPKAGGSGNNNNNFSNGGFNNYGARFSVTQPVDIFGLVPAGIAVSRLTIEFYETDLERTENEVALTTKEDFINVLSAQDNVATEQEQVNAATEGLRIAKAQYGVGTIAEYDLLSAESTLSNAQQALLSAQNSLDLALASLNYDLGRSQMDTVTVQAPALPPLNQTFDLNSLIQTAFKERPELRQADMDIAIAKKLVYLNRAAAYPALAISGSADFDGPKYAGVDSNSWSVTADLGMPLYDGGATRARVRSAELSVQTQLVTQQQLQQSVALEVRQAYVDILNAQSRVAAAQAGADEAGEALRIANIRYQNQLGTLLDLANAEAQEATARNNLTTAQQDYLTGLAELTRAEGSR